MREIKFRAWDKLQKNMGVEFSLADAAYEGFPYPFVDANGDYNSNADYEVMQFTGLLDKNGKEIYEGDILRYTKSYRKEGEKKSQTELHYWEVFFGDSGSWMSRRQGSTDERLSNKHDTHEVIGNIYENPDLLSKGTNTHP